MCGPQLAVLGSMWALNPVEGLSILMWAPGGPAWLWGLAEWKA